MDDQQLKASLEALLFIAGTPLSVDRLKGIFEEETKEQIEQQLDVVSVPVFVLKASRPEHRPLEDRTH